MHLFAPFSLGAFLIYLFMGFYVLFINPKSRNNRLFFWLSFLLAEWTFQKAYVDLALDKELLIILYRYLSMGIYLVPGALLHFTLSYTGRDSLLKKWWFYLLLYGYGVGRTIAAFMGYFTVTDFISTQWGWTPVYASSSFWYITYNLYMLICINLSLYFINQWRKKAVTNKEKKQGQIFFWSLLLSITMGLITDLIIPLTHSVNLPSISQIFLIFFMFAVLYIINRFRMLRLNNIYEIESVISKMNQAVVVIDKWANILTYNENAKLIFDLKDDELKGLPMEKCLSDTLALRNVMSKIKSDDNDESFIEAFINKKHIKIAVSLIYDRDKDLIGYFLILTELIDLRKIIELYGISNRESEILSLMVKGYSNDEIADKLFISPETVKTHSHRIYRKTGVKNRLKLAELIKQ